VANPVSEEEDETRRRRRSSGEFVRGNGAYSAARRTGFQVAEAAAGPQMREVPPLRPQDRKLLAARLVEGTLLPGRSPKSTDILKMSRVQFNIYDRSYIVV
jgi:hypothetical protein